MPFASYLGEFTRDHPGIDLRLQYAPGLTMISMVETGELDCVIGPAVSQVPGVRMTRRAWSRCTWPAALIIAWRSRLRSA